MPQLPLLSHDAGAEARRRRVGQRSGPLLTSFSGPSLSQLPLVDPRFLLFFLVPRQMHTLKLKVRILTD